MKRALLVMAAVVAVSGVCGQEIANGDRHRLQGEWKLVSITFADKEMPKGQKSLLVIKGNKAIMKGEGMADDEATFTLNEIKQPKIMIIAKTPKYAELWCIYKLDGDNMLIAMTKAGDPAPPGFDAKNVTVVTFKKLKR